MNRWQLQEAKSRFSEVIELALEKGPQIITRRGQETAVLISAEEFRRLQSLRKPLGQFLLHSPLRGSNLDLRRVKDQPRKGPEF
ncbi:MAG TPA: type II toxin-antitoxin system Phd/YefM family antitoxin [Tepidisphaeraceae bacterium]|jgi:prevent-host-death family protein